MATSDPHAGHWAESCTAPHPAQLEIAWMGAASPGGRSAADERMDSHDAIGPLLRFRRMASGLCEDFKKRINRLTEVRSVLNNDSYTSPQFPTRSKRSEPLEHGPNLAQTIDRLP